MDAPWQVDVGDCRTLLAALPPASVDAVVTDPPYGLEFMGRGWDRQVPGVAFWAEVIRVLRPGGHLVAFGGTRTHHRLWCAIEDAGFEIRDCLMYLYGTGFPKSLNIGCKCDDRRSPQSQHDVRPVRRTDLPTTVNDADQPGQILLAGMSKQSTPEHGAARAEPKTTRGEQSGMERGRDPVAEARELPADQICSLSSGVSIDGTEGRIRDGAPLDYGENDRASADAGRGGTPSQPRSAGQSAGEPGTIPEQQGAQVGGRCEACGGLIDWDGWGTALKPAWEPICLARKPLAGTVAANLQEHGTGAINVDGCRIETTDNYRENTVTQGINTARTSFEPLHKRRTFAPGTGRWPANVCLDEAAAAQLDAQSGHRVSGTAVGGLHRHSNKTANVYGRFNGNEVEGDVCYGDAGGASRFYYCAKAIRAERNAGLPPGVRNTHPTVKPVALMRWLVRMVTPPGGLVLDPFAGSGSTGVAAVSEGFRFHGLELDPAYAAIARARIADAGRQGVLPL